MFACVCCSTLTCRDRVDEKHGDRVNEKQTRHSRRRRRRRQRTKTFLSFRGCVQIRVELTRLVVDLKFVCACVFLLLCRIRRIVARWEARTGKVDSTRRRTAR